MFAAGTRNRHAGAMLALGHGLVEFPLMLTIIMGMGRLLELHAVKTAIGLAGGLVLLLMGVQLLIDARKGNDTTAPTVNGHPFQVGILLSIGNPYFLIWWATVGLALVTQAAEWGILAFVLFAVIHWLCKNQ